MYVSIYIGRKQSVLGYFRPYLGDRYASPIIVLSDNDLLSYSFTYNLKPKPEFIPAGYNVSEETWRGLQRIYGDHIIKTETFAFGGPRYVKLDQ